MRQRSIHSIAHWTIMTLLLLFPVLMVGISSFTQDSQEVTVTETYQYQTNEVNSVDDLIVGNIYKFKHIINIDDIINCPFNIDNGNNTMQIIYRENIISNNNDNYINYGLNIYNNAVIDYFEITYTHVDNDIQFQIICDDENDTQTFSLDVASMPNNTYFLNMYFICLNSSEFLEVDFISASDYLGELNTDVQITNANYKQDINNWCSEFINLPVNGWYQSLMNVMGIGLTNNSVMNVIYVMPLYIIWVFILDLVVDIILVIVRLPHKALNKLGGENE